MKRFSTLIQKYLIFASPIVLATMIWGTYQSDREIRTTGSFAIKALWEVMSWSLIIWFLLLFIFMLLLAFRKETQESAIKYLAGMKERDEREEIIMGSAAKRSFTATVSFLVFLLFLSCLTLNIAKIPPDQVIDGKSSSLSLGFRLMESFGEETTAPSDNKVIYEHRDLPLSKSSLILLILVWQVAIFRLRARKELALAS